MNYVDEIKRELKFMDEIKKTLMFYCPKIRIMQNE